MSKTVEKAVLPAAELSQFGKFRPGTVRVLVRRDIKPEELHSVLDRIFDLNGCTTCGLNGLDLIFRQVTPIDDHFRSLKNIASVEAF